MKKTIIAGFAAVALMFGVAAPAQADAADRRLVKNTVISVFYQQTYDEQDTLCWGWKNYPSMAYSSLMSAFNGTGISRSDVRSGIRQGFNAVC